MISCHGYSYNHRENHHNSLKICLQCTTKETHNYKFKNCGFLLDQQYIYSFLGSDLCQYLSINITRFPTYKSPKETVHFFKTTMLHPWTAPISNVKIKIVSKVYDVLYNYSAVKTLCSNANLHNNTLETYTCLYITFIQLHIFESIENARSFLSCTFTYL